MTASDLDEALAETIARHVVDVPGVAFLRPGLVDALRAAARTGVPRIPDRPPAGVRVTRHRPTGAWQIDVQIVIHRGHRALDIARAVREAVITSLTDATTDEEDALRVAVTVANTF